MRRPLLAAILLLVAPPVWGQQRFWANSVNGLWDDPSKWSLNDAPDSAGESAVFDRFGSFFVSLPDTGPITIDDWRVEHGDPTFQSAGFGLATLDAGGDATFSADARLRGGAGSFAAQIAGTLLVEPAANLEISGAAISAGAASVSGGSLTAPTLFVLDNSASADFGSLDIASSGAETSRGSVDLYDGSTLTVGNLQIASEVSNTIGELNVLNSQLQQDSGSTTVGFPNSEVGQNASLAISGGSAALGSLTINATGLVRNVGGSLGVAGTLRVEGGAFEEAGAATRNFADASLIIIQSNGRMELAGAGLVVEDGQRLEVIDGSFSSAGGLIVAEGGTLSVGGDAETVINSETKLEAGSSLLVGNEGTNRFVGAFVDEGDGVRLRNGSTVEFARDYKGSRILGNGLLRFEGETQLASISDGGVYTSDLEWTSTARMMATLPSTGEEIPTTPQVLVTGNATLAGELALAGEDWTAAEGDTFQLLAANSLTGSFDTLSAPALPAGLEWRVLQTATSLSARIVAPGIAGDFNYDGLVDAADYSVWRDTLGSEGPLLAADANNDQIVDSQDRDAWTSAYGTTAEATPVPEPSALLAVMALIFCGFPVRYEVARPRACP